MAINKLFCFAGRVLVILGLILFVPPAMILFLLYDSLRWLLPRHEPQGAAARRGPQQRAPWRTGPSFG